jgi:hypothetical protein
MLGNMRWIAIVVFVLGCGEVKVKPDGGGPGGDSGNGDGAMPDGPSVGAVTVEVLLNGTATGGLKVNFHESDGSLAAEAVTDTAGKASGTVHLNAMVTVAVGTKDLVTIAGVNPAEHILLKTRPPYDRSTVGSVNFGTTTEAANKSYYRVETGDDYYVTVQTMTTGTRTTNLIRGNLDANGKFSLIAGTYDVNNRLISYTYSNGITPSSSGTTTVTLPAWRTDLLEFALSMTGAPTGATTMRVDSSNEQTGFLFMPTAFGNAAAATVAISGGNASKNVQYPGNFGDNIRTDATVRFGTARDSMIFSRRAPRPAGAYAIGSADFPARIGAAAIDNTTPTRPVANWTVTGSTTNGDATLVEFVWTSGGADYTWHAYVPPDATSVTFPVVANSLAGQAPAAGTTLSSITVTQHNLEPLAGWAAFRLAPAVDYVNTYDMPPGFMTWNRATTYTIY